MLTTSKNWLRSTILQGGNCNEQIPAKIYEYLRARKPIFALTDPAGDTAQLLASCSITSIARLDDAAAIEILLESFLDGDTRGFSVADDFDVKQFSRKK